MEGKEILLTAVSEKLQYMGRALRNPHHFSIARGNCYAVIGENGCGKTTLGKIIEKGWNICTNVIHGDKKSLTINNIEFSDIHSFTGSNVAYYQQRFEATQNDEIPTVEEIIRNRIPTDRWNELCDRLSLRDIMHKRINFLSSGELRKFLIINLFSTTPDILIIDNPYIGLDAQSRDLFNELINNITGEGTAVILLLCNPIDIPTYCNYILPMKDMEIGEMRPTTDFSPHELDKLFSQKGNVDEMPIAKNCGIVDFDTAIKLNNCNVCYGKNVILHNVSWEVKAGDKWALLGENGCGKSTLLSLVYADNPQGYHNDITLFDHRRGTGESIWDIKRHIGYVSPEMARTYRRRLPVIDIVASGLHDTVGLYRKPTDAEREDCRGWLRLWGVEAWSERSFMHLSDGEQRLVLLIRAFVKNPALLELDEPFHGLDCPTRHRAMQILEACMRQPGRTLIMVSHYADQLPPCINRRLTLEKGRVQTVE